MLGAQRNRRHRAALSWRAVHPSVRLEAPLPARKPIAHCSKVTAAKRICEALRAAGIEVWFDQSELRGGDAWDRRQRRSEQAHDSGRGGRDRTRRRGQLHTQGGAGPAKFLRPYVDDVSEGPSPVSHARRRIYIYPSIRESHVNVNKGS